MKTTVKKNSLIISDVCILIKKQKLFLLSLFFCISSNCKAQQITNYVNNGSFEEVVPNMYPYPKYWGGIDTTKQWGQILSSVIFPFLVPHNSFCYQWPRHGNNFLITGLFDPSHNPGLRGYPRNRLKKTLEAGKAYCVSFFVNLTNQSTHGIDAIGVYFSDNSLDTIQLSNNALTYLTPQIQNPTNNVIIDTLNWTLISGQFTANGTEKYLVIGNFKSDANTDTTFVNPANLPTIFADYNIDGVSVIEVNLPAYAGPDKAIFVGDSAFIGRQPDFAIDKDCIWYKLPNTTNAIDTVSGLWVKPVVTSTYVVKQNLECGSLKWDTVVIYMDAVGLAELGLESLEFSLYPNPAKDILNVRGNIDSGTLEATTYNAFGQMLKEEKIIFKNKIATIKTDDLPNGVYVLKLQSENSQTIAKRFVINH